jgi:RNA-directed DNA polymerase
MGYLPRRWNPPSQMQPPLPSGSCHGLIIYFASGNVLPLVPPSDTHPLYCTRNQKGNFRIGMRTEKTRLRRALMRLQDQMRRIRHLTLQDQVNHLNQVLRGHYAYYGVAGNIQALLRVHRAVERYWRKMLSSRSWKATIQWKQFQRIKEQFPLLRPKLYLPYRALQAIAIL